jgi:hypothetical protein
MNRLLSVSGVAVNQTYSACIDKWKQVSTESKVYSRKMHKEEHYFFTATPLEWGDLWLTYWSQFTGQGNTE